MKEANQEINRRRFLNQGALGVGALAAGGAALVAAPAEKSVNPFAYDVTRFALTDPRLIHYELVSRFPSRLTEPRRIAVGPEGQVYLAGKTGVGVFDRQGSLVAEMPLTAPARCLAVSRDGTLYVGLKDHVEVFDKKGQRTATWEAPEKNAWLTGLCVGEKDLFAADSGHRLIWRYDRSGKLLGRLGEKSKEHSVPGLIVPSPYLDVDLGPDGLLRVNNPGRHCVEVYTLSGELELSWGKPSAAIEGFCGCCNPISLACLPDGRWVTCEKGLPRVKVYAADGTFDCVVAGPESFPENAKPGSARDLSDGSMGGLDAAADSQGQIYILDLVAADVRVMKRKA